MNNWFLYHSVCFYGFTLLPSKDSNYIHIFKFFSNYFLPFFLFSFRPLYITWIFLTYTFYLVLFIFSLVFAKSNSFLLPCNKVLKTQWQNIYIYYLVFVGQNSRSSLARCIWFWVSQEAASKVSAAASITSRLNWRNIHSELSHVVVSRTQDRSEQYLRSAKTRQVFCLVCLQARSSVPNVDILRPLFGSSWLGFAVIANEEGTF